MSTSARWRGPRNYSRPAGRSCTTRYVIPPACARGTPTAPLSTPSLYTKNAAAFFAPGSPMRTRSSRECPGIPGHSLLPLDTGRSGMRLKDEAGVYRGADGAAPSRAGPRLNPAHTMRAPTGQRRITARVMRSFGRRLPHTLPFQAHPRVASRPKSPARARATLFDLPATLTGWNRKRSVPLALRYWSHRTLLVMPAPPHPSAARNAVPHSRDLSRGTPRYAPGSPLPGLHPV